MPDQHCQSEGCARTCDPGQFVCCEACMKWPGIHSNECWLRTFPEAPYLEYSDDPNKVERILERLQRAIALAHALDEEFKVLSGALKRFVPGHTASLETMISHTRLDLSYLELEARRILGS